jgi:hypothetical protein
MEFADRTFPKNLHLTWKAPAVLNVLNPFRLAATQNIRRAGYNATSKAFRRPPASNFRVEGIDAAGTDWHTASLGDSQRAVIITCGCLVPPCSTDTHNPVHAQWRGSCLGPSLPRPPKLGTVVQSWHAGRLDKSPDIAVAAGAGDYFYRPLPTFQWNQAWPHSMEIICGATLRITQRQGRQLIQESGSAIQAAPRFAPQPGRI